MAPRVLWRALRKEGLVFHLLLLYLVFEYWKLQVVWPQIDVIPWGQVTILASFAAYVLSEWRTRRFHAMDGLFIAFCLWVGVTMITAWSPSIAYRNWAGIASWIFLYFLVTHVVTGPRRMFLLWVAFMVLNLKMSQHGARGWAMRGFSFADWGASGSPVWFQNSGEFSMQMVIFIATSWCFLQALKPHLTKRMYWIMAVLLPGTAVMSVLASSSRGGQLAGLVVLVLLVGASRRRFKSLAAAGLVLAAAWLFLPQEQKDRFSTMGDDDTSESRLTYWRDARTIISERPIFGIGYENWGAYYARRYNVRPEEVHNTFYEAGVELGIPGLLLFAAMIVASFRSNQLTRRRSRGKGPWGDLYVGMATGLDLAMVGLVVASMFMSVLFYPVYWMAFALTVSVSESSRRLRVEARVRAPIRRPRGVGRIATGEPDLA